MSVHDALLLIGHGSVRFPDAARAIHLQAEALRQTRRLARVAVGLLNGAPSVAQALAEIGSTPIRVVPYFMEDGYFTRVAVPRALGGRQVKMCPPIGVHDAMAGLIERQALAACAATGFSSRDAAVLVAGHGSSSAPGRTLALHRHASRVAATELFCRVESACLEEAPFVADALSGLRAHPVIVIGFFAGEGGHVRDDVPALIEAERSARGEAGLSMRFHGSVTDDPAMTEIILDQATHDLTGE